MSDQPSAGISPVKVGLKYEFKFSCHPQIPCFTSCCRGINIVLTPYDIIRLKNRLELSSDDFLAIYTQPQLLEKTDIPVVTLKLMDDELQSCPFVKPDGCIVYADRPTTCRYYPLGIAALTHKEQADDQDFYFFVHEPHCKGFDEQQDWKVCTWRKDQGVDIHDEINAEWTDLVVRKRTFPPNIKFTEKTKSLFFMVSYNIDGFHRFVFESSFLQRYDLENELIEKIRHNEIELFRFGVKWLKGMLFQGQEKVNLRENNEKH